MDSFLANLAFYVPELTAILTMMGLLFLEAACRNGKGRGFVFISGFLGLLLTLIALLVNTKSISTTIFTRSIVIDSFGTLLKILMVIGTMGSLWLAKVSREIQAKSEFFILAIGVLIGGMLLASANNMLTVYLGIETLSILSYVMASLGKNNESSSEAGLKYVLYGGVSAGIMLFGMSHIYGVLGTIEFSGISSGLETMSRPWILLPAFLFFFVGIGYKIACVPFHMWSPDVYEGSPTPVTAFFAMIPKIAGIACLIRVSTVFFPSEGLLQTSWIGLLQIIAAITMTVGNVSAIDQRSVKRILAWSSIAHIGMILAGIVVMNELGIRAVVFYLFIYIFMSMVTFFITAMVSDHYGNDHLERFRGLFKSHPLAGMAMTISLFSLAGLPPLSGFIAKFNIISVIIAKGYYTLAVIAVFNSVISLYYYMKIVRIMIFKKGEGKSVAGLGFLNQTIIITLVIPVVFFGIFWEGILSLSGHARIWP